MARKISADKEQLMEELLFYLRKYEELTSRTASMKRFVDREIDELVKTIKRLK